jgi:hypothetical protein
VNDFYVNGGTGGPSLIYVFGANASGAPAPIGVPSCCNDPTGLSALANLGASAAIAVQRSSEARRGDTTPGGSTPRASCPIG